MGLHTYPTDKPSKQEFEFQESEKMMSKLMKVFMMSSQKENSKKSERHNIHLGDPVMVVPLGNSSDRSIDLSGIVVAFDDDDETRAVVVWDVPGLGLESVLPVDRLTAIVN